jgi:hypothetical protein
MRLWAKANYKGAFIRAARTFAQGFLATTIALVLGGQFTETVNGATIPKWDSLDTLFFAGITSGTVSLGTWLWNVIEEKFGKTPGGVLDKTKT